MMMKAKFSLVLIALCFTACAKQVVRDVEPLVIALPNELFKCRVLHKPSNATAEYEILKGYAESVKAWRSCFDAIEALKKTQNQILQKEQHGYKNH